MEREWRDMEDLVTVTFQELGSKAAETLPDILGAVIVLIIGLLIAGSLGTLARKLLRATGVDGLVQSTAIGQKLNVVPNMRFSPSRFLGWLVKWFFILVTLIVVSSILEWDQINQFLNAVALYIPNVLIAVIILVIGFIASNFVSTVVAASLERSPLDPGERQFLASVARVSIVVFAVMASLIQLRIAEDLLRVLFTGVIFAISLALGLAFGLGGREEAGQFIKRLVERSRSRGGQGSSTPQSF